MPGLRLVFMGTAAFAVPSLEAIHAAGHDIARVYSQPPRPAGRGHRPRQNPVHDAAERLGLDVETPTSLRDEAAQEIFAALGCDACVVVAYGLILPRAVLDAPRLGCLNVHPSLLPRWRGPAPIPRTIEAGDAATGVAVIQMAEGIDTGPVLLVERVPVPADATGGTLHDDLAARGGRLIVAALDGVAASTLAATPQADDGATYAAKLTKDEGRLDWRRPAVELERLVRALAPRPGAWFEAGDARVKVLAADVVGDTGAPGTLIGDDLTVACGAAALRLVTVQRAGKAPADGAAYLRGARLAVGTVLG